MTHLLIVAADTERETFQARDNSGGFSNQDRTRRHESLTAEWRADAKALTGDVAIRRDLFSRFKDATSIRASMLGRLGGGFSIAGSYAEGIAQPTFLTFTAFSPEHSSEIHRLSLRVPADSKCPCAIAMVPSVHRSPAIASASTTRSSTTTELHQRVQCAGCQPALGD